MSEYSITVEAVSTGTLFRLAFGQPAQNDAIVKAAAAALTNLGEVGGPLALLNGPASLPVACVLAHALGHRFGAVAVFDPKMGSYVVAISHDPARPLGSVIPA